MFATIRKEFLLLLRDPAGLLLLIVMPVALIIVMALVQDAPYRDYQKTKFELLIANADKGSAGGKIINKLKQSPNFIIVDSLAGGVVTTAAITNNLKNGKYKMGLVIPANATISLVNMSNKLANQMASAVGLPATLPVADKDDSSVIQMFFDPAVKPAMRTALNFALTQYLTKIKIEILLDRMSKMSGNAQAPTISMDDAQQVLSLSEQSLDDNQLQVNPLNNSVQHNVPAWAIFGMFLIVVPISGNMIRERDEGSAMRIQLIPNAATATNTGRIVFYVLTCMVQFLVMLLAGVYLLPFFGLPSLYLGVHPWALLPMVFAIAFAAVNYGNFIGNVFKTANQAMPFGAISIVLLSAIGGVWVPVEILPVLMRRVAMLSPLHWSLLGIDEIILRNNNVAAIAPAASALITIGLVFYFFARMFGKKA